MSWSNSDTAVLMTTQRKSSLKGGSWPWDNHLSSLTWLKIPTLRALIRYLPFSVTAWKSSRMNVPVSSWVLPFHPSLMRGALGRHERFPTAELPKEHTDGKRGKNGQGVEFRGKKATHNCHECLIEKEKGSPGLIQVMSPTRKLFKDVVWIRGLITY